MNKSFYMEKETLSGDLSCLPPLSLIITITPTQQNNNHNSPQHILPFINTFFKIGKRTIIFRTLAIFS